MNRVITVGRGFYNHAFLEGGIEALGEVQVGSHYVRVPATAASVRELYAMAEYANNTAATPPATKGYARKLRERLEQDYGEFLA